MSARTQQARIHPGAGHRHIDTDIGVAAEIALCKRAVQGRGQKRAGGPVRHADARSPSPAGPSGVDQPAGCTLLVVILSCNRLPQASGQQSRWRINRLCHATSDTPRTSSPCEGPVAVSSLINALKINLQTSLEMIRWFWIDDTPPNRDNVRHRCQLGRNQDHEYAKDRTGR